MAPLSFRIFALSYSVITYNNLRVLSTFYRKVAQCFLFTYFVQMYLKNVMPNCSLFSPYNRVYVRLHACSPNYKVNCISILARWAGLILETCYPFGWVSANICFTCQDELLFEMHLERRITKGSSSWWVTRQMAVIVQETQIYITGNQSCEKWERLTVYSGGPMGGPPPYCW